jgi:hypothetical protein
MLQRIAVGSMLLLALAFVALGVVLVMSSPRQSPALLVYPAIAGVYTVGAVGLHRRRRWGALVAGLAGVIGTLLMLVVLVFVAASLAYYDWRSDLPVVAGLPTYPSLGILVAILLANLAIVVAASRSGA